jgi:replication fork clamp-binding protein CrfC
MNQQYNVSAATMVVKTQKCSDLELEIQRLSELEAEKFAKLEQRYTEEDLVFAWCCGYESRKMEEK